MSSLATRRLIDAAATLDPADRALLNLWVNRGLDDERLTELTGMSIEALEARREKIVAQLAAELGLPEHDIRGALEQISPDEEFVTPPGPEGISVEPSSPNGGPPAAASEPAAEAPQDTAQPAEAPQDTAQPAEAPQDTAQPAEAPQDTAQPAEAPQDTAQPAEAPQDTAQPAEAPQDTAQPAEAPQDTAQPAEAPQDTAQPTPPTDEPSPRPRRGLWLGLVALAIIVAAVIVGLTGGGSSPQKSHRAASTASTPTTATQTPTVPVPTHPTGGPVPVPLAGLPGGLPHAAGMIKLSGPVKHLKLNLNVRGLPAPHAGHYEVWLYNSVLDSRPLARLRAGHHRLVARLPAPARRYRWIDISFQPVGAINHSGESELRASSPAHTTKARLRKRSSRTRHRLRQASKVSAAHPATGN